MKKSFVRACAPLVAAISLAMVAGEALAITGVFRREMETDLENRPLFPSGYFDGVTTFLNPAGYSGTATPGDANPNDDAVSNVTGTGLGIGGDDGNGVPLGVSITFEVSFTVEATGAGHTLSDGTEVGMAVNSGGGEPFPTSLNGLADVNAPPEQLFFGAITVSNVSILDPLGLLESGALGNAQWRAFRGSTHNSGDKARTSSDAAQTQNITLFETNASVTNDYVAVFPVLPSVYLTTTAGDWRLKGIQYQLEFEHALAAPPTSRRTFKFGDPLATYNNAAAHQITDNDLTVSILPVGNGAVLGTNDNGVGVDSIDDNPPIPTDMLGVQRRIDGTLPTPEALHFSFGRDVMLESLTLGTFELDGTESAVLKFVSGTNPFMNLSGYSGDYVPASDSITFTTTAGGETPFVVTYGMGGQSQIFVEANTVLSIAANPAFEGGFLLDMITVNVPPLDADFDNNNVVDSVDLDTWKANFGSTTGSNSTGDANHDNVVDGDDFLIWQRQLNMPGVVGVPEPSGALLLTIAGTCLWRRRVG